MKIAYDATTLGLTKGGTTVYLRNLIENLRLIEPVNEYDLYSTNLINHNNYFTKKIETLYREFFWREKVLPKIAFKNKSDIIHFPNHYSTLKSKIPTVVSFHDIYVLKNPDAFPISQVKYSQFIIPKILRSANKIIASSNFTKNEIINHFDIDKSKLEVIHLGVHPIFTPIQEESDLKQVEKKYNLPEKFILYVGAIEPRKNVDKLVEAFDIARNNCNISLVIVSFGGWKNENVYRTIKNSSNSNHIHLIGYVSDNDLPRIYKLAKAFVYPSSYEGFGLPILEAMSCGCPVIGTMNTVANEVIGNAGILTETSDKFQLAEAILSLCEDNTSKKYSNLGLERSKQFSWNQCAKKTLELYHSIT